MSGKNKFLKKIEMKRRDFFLKIIGRFSSDKILFSSEVRSQKSEVRSQKSEVRSQKLIFSRRSFLQLSSFIASASFLSLLIPKKAKAFGGFGLMRQGAAATPYVDDVFSAYTYTGNGAAQTITNGIDLAGKGGLVWCKQRSSEASWNNNVLVDTVRGADARLFSDSTMSQSFNSSINNFSSNGVAVNGVDTNTSGRTYVSWTFRRSAKFFDIVTYTGNGSGARTISHSLGIAPGMVIFKNTNGTEGWMVYHRGATGWLWLNLTDAQGGSLPISNITATSFVVNAAYNGTNTNGATYVAYLFAHDTSTDGIIQCGSYVGNGIDASQVINLGWKPQYIIVKASSAGGTNYDWIINDSARGLLAPPSAGKSIFANQSISEFSQQTVSILPNGFTPIGVSSNSNQNGVTYIYLAIRRPNKPPTLGTQVYNAIARTGTGAAATVTGVGFAPDLFFEGNRGSNSSEWYDKLRGPNKWIMARSTLAEATMTDSVNSFNMDGITVGTDTGNNEVNYSGWNYIYYFFKRAPGVFDIVCYTGTGAAMTVAHNLGVAPELSIIKDRSNPRSWCINTQFGLTSVLELNLDATLAGSTLSYSLAQYSGATTPTNLLLGAGTVSTMSAHTYVTYLFATKSGISKVGSYLGTNASQNIDCGFTAGPRFTQ